MDAHPTDDESSYRRYPVKDDSLIYAFSQTFKATGRTSEEKLLLAQFEQAVNDLKKKGAVRNEAIRWIKRRDPDWVFGFDFIAETILKTDPGRLRRALLRSLKVLVLGWYFLFFDGYTGETTPIRGFVFAEQCESYRARLVKREYSTTVQCREEKRI